MLLKTVKHKGNLIIETSIQDEGDFHSWKCFFTLFGGWKLVRYGKYTFGKEWQEYECGHCHAIKRVEIERRK